MALGVVNRYELQNELENLEKAQYSLLERFDFPQYIDEINEDIDKLSKAWGTENGKLQTQALQSSYEGLNDIELASLVEEIKNSKASYYIYEGERRVINNE